MSDAFRVAMDIEVAALHASTTENRSTAAIGAIADLLLRTAALDIGGVAHRICEVEAYVNGPSHVDVYTHGNAVQHTTYQWYFHMAGTGYKGGSYKGLDIALGDAATAVGFLVRCVKELGGDGKVRVTEGPSLVVDRVLELSGAKSVAAFVAANAVTNVWACTDLRLRAATPSEVCSAQGMFGPRVGLTLKAANQLAWVVRLYRFITAEEVPAKARFGFAAALMGDVSVGTGEISRLVKQTPGKVREWQALYKSGAEGAVTLEGMISEDIRSPAGMMKLMAIAKKH